MSKSKRTRAQVRESTGVMAIAVGMTLALFCRAGTNNAAESSQEKSGLRIYMPREISVGNSELNLGQVGIIRGEDALVAKANGVALGRISAPGQSLVIDRPTVLSRLACSGIPTSKVTLTGAEETTVRQQHRVVGTDEFVSLASSFLENHRPGTSVSRWTATRKPENLVVPGTYNDIRFSPRLSESNATNQVRVEIAVLGDGKKIAVRDVMFALKYNCRQAVTKTDIAAGQAITPENVEIQTVESNYPEPAAWNSPYGLIAKHRLPASTTLRPHMVGPSESPTVITRNQTVAIKVERPGLVITAMGKAMDDGKAGEYIKVRNVDSQRIILVKINTDGSVEPAL